MKTSDQQMSSSDSFLPLRETTTTAVIRSPQQDINSDAMLTNFSATVLDKTSGKSTSSEGLFTSTWNDLVEFYSSRKAPVASQQINAAMSSIKLPEIKPDITIPIGNAARPAAKVEKSSIGSAMMQQLDNSQVATKQKREIIVKVASSGMKVVRRKVLNLFDRPTEQWANAIRPDKDPYGANVLMTNRELLRSSRAMAASTNDAMTTNPSNSSKMSAVTSSLGKLSNKFNQWLFGEDELQDLQMLDTSIIRQIPKEKLITKQLKIFSKGRRGKLSKRRRTEKKSRWQQIKTFVKSLVEIDVMEDVDFHTMYPIDKAILDGAKRFEMETYTMNANQALPDSNTLSKSDPSNASPISNNNNNQPEDPDRPNAIKKFLQVGKDVVVGVGYGVGDVVKDVAGKVRKVKFRLPWDKDDQESFPIEDDLPLTVVVDNLDIPQPAIEIETPRSRMLKDPKYEVPFETKVPMRKKKFFAKFFPVASKAVKTVKSIFRRKSIAEEEELTSTMFDAEMESNLAYSSASKVIELSDSMKVDSRSSYGIPFYSAFSRSDANTSNQDLSSQTDIIDDEADIRDEDIIEYQNISAPLPAFPINKSSQVEDMSLENIENKNVFKLPFSINDFYMSAERMRSDIQLKSNESSPPAATQSWISWPFREDFGTTTTIDSNNKAIPTSDSIAPSSSISFPKEGIDDSVKVGRAQDLKLVNQGMVTEVPLPSKADFAFLALRQVEVAISAALSVKSERDAKEFMQAIGPDSIIAGILGTTILADKFDRVDAVKSLCRLMRWYRPLTDTVGQRQDLIDTLCDMMEAPLRGFKTFQSQMDKERELRAQHEAVAFVQRLVRTSDIAVANMKQHSRLRKVLLNIVQSDTTVSQNTLKLSKTLSSSNQTIVEPIPLSYEDAQASKSIFVKKKNSTTIVEYVNLRPSQMARVASWGLGGVPWKPKLPGQKGLRILSLDGGGTRGVLTIALLKELFKRLPGDLQPHDVFDIICGTSTGGIIAMLLGGQKRSIAESEFLYDEFIGKIFSQKSNLKFVREQAFYDESGFEKILEQMCGDQLILDSNQQECPRVFCVSSKLNSYPPETMIWRNYNYPTGVKSRYPGTFRVNTKTAIRATTAAPTFFTPVQWENQLFCDGAILANNPTAIAFQESKVRFLYLKLMS